MHGRFALWWIGVAIVFAVLGLAPRIVDQIASLLGIGYPPILVVILGIGFLILKIIMMDIERSTNLVKLHRLTQRMAILEGLLQNQNDKKAAGKSE